MGTAILLSHHCLQGRLRNDALALATSRVRSRTNSTFHNQNIHSHAYHNRRCKRTSVAPNHLDRDRSLAGDRSAKVPTATNVVILQRGEKLSLENNSPMTVKKIRVLDAKEMMYAGSAFVTSPPLSFVPVPGCLGRNDATTNDLRLLLRLD